jgi:aminoglycoside phosphotransferase family enzyme/predicted kinase
VKKPIQNAFLDYTTLDLRKHFCEEELRLNQRFADALYLDVVAIAEHDGRLRVSGTGRPVEYAVQMTRFPEGALLCDRLARNAVTLRELQQLASRIAEFHQSADVSESSSRFGSPELVYQEAIENIQHLEAVKIDLLVDVLPELKSWTRDHFEGYVAMFLERKMGGHIRECHGDLHLGNIVEWNNKLVPFDGIEFCDEFRWIDTLSDTAFTAMDLAAHGRMDFCHSFINAYLEAIGDYGSVKVLHWYLVYRALVRAKVASIRYVQAENDQVTHDKTEEEITNLLKLARHFSKASLDEPRLWITNGVSGSGKTTGTEATVQQYGAIRIRADVERKRILGLKPLDRVAKADETESALYSEEMSDRTYDRLIELAKELLQNGNRVIVDATFLVKERRLRFRKLADELHVPFQILAFNAEPEILRQRIKDRLAGNRDASDANLSVLNSQLNHQHPLDEDELPLTVFY